MKQGRASTCEQIILAPNVESSPPIFTSYSIRSIYFSFELSRVGMRFLVSFDEMMLIAPFVSEFVMIFGGYVRVSVSRKK